MTQHRTVILRDDRDKLGTRQLDATLSADGTLTIEGQDFGDGVEQIFGSGLSQYEWVLTIQSKDIPKLASVLDEGNDVLAALVSRFSNDEAVALQPFLDKHDIQYEFWNWIGG